MLSNMRVKYLWDHVPLPAKVKLFWERITFSRITTVYFIFSVLHCLIQVVFQVQAFTINADAAKFLSGIIEQGNATEPGFAVLTQDGMRMCTQVPNKVDASSCMLVYQWDNVAANVSGQNAVEALPSLYPLSTHAASFVSLSPSSSIAAASTSGSAIIPSSSATILSSSAAVPSSLRTQASSSVPSTQSRIINTITTRPTGASTSDVQDGALALATPTSTRTITVTLHPSATQASNADGVDDDALDNIVHLTRRSHIDPVIRVTTDNGQKEVKINGLNGKDGEVTLTEQCLRTLMWPVEQVDNTKREDIVFIGFQVWVLGMSLVALLNESIPHMYASLLTHMLATAWGGFQISNTKQFHAQFSRLTTRGACGINLLPTYWSDRDKAEVPSLVLNVVALMVSCFLTWRLIKLFGWQTFKRVGASLTIRRVYTAVLVQSIAIQLSVFFIVVSGALWIDQIYNGDIASLTLRRTMFKAITILVLVMLIPWLTLGWIAVRREYRIAMLIFLILSILYLVGWSAMFIAPTFRWTFVQWRFFSIMTSASVFLTVISFILGVICRVNFGKGLSHHLSAQEPLPDDDFVPVVPTGEKGDLEKFEFPSTDAPIPTFSAAYGAPKAPAPAYVGHTMGPRFNNPALRPFDPQPAHTRSDTVSSNNSSRSGRTLERSSSAGSQLSVSTESRGRNKRWVIE